MFPSFPNSSPAFLFCAARPLTQQEADSALSHLRRYFADLKNHGKAVMVDAEWAFNRTVLVVAADDRSGSLGGCTKDSLWREVLAVERSLDVPLVGSPVFRFEENGTIRSVNQMQFENLAKEGKISGKTKGFCIDTTTLGAVREGKWLAPVETFWMGETLKEALELVEAGA